MGYLENNLHEDEQCVARVVFSKAAYIPAILLAVLMLLVGAVAGNFSAAFGAAVIVGGGYALIVYIIFKTTVCVVTNKRLLCKKGLICKRTMDVMLDKIDTIYFSNGLLGAIFHYGSLKFISASFFGLNILDRAILHYGMVANITDFKKGVLQALEDAKADNRQKLAVAIGTEVGKASDTISK